jgi:uncharacterized membrane protein
MKKLTLILFTIFVLIILVFSTTVQAQEDSQREVKYKAKITELLVEQCPQDLGEGECYFFKLEILEGDKKGEIVGSTLSITDTPRLDVLNYKIGQSVYAVETQVGEDIQYYVKEPIRLNSIITLTITFILFVIIVGGLQGITSLIGLLVSFAVLIIIVIPMILSGTNPLLASILGGSLIMTISVFLSHGFNRKTAIAFLGTLISLIITGILSIIYTAAVRLTGYSTDEATFLVQLIDKQINMQGVLLASLIIGGIGILDDITVSQVSTILEIFKANPTFNWRELFARSMKVGRDHIASMVNTLVLAYTGSALPLVMLFIASGATFEEIINSEIVAEEIVRTLVGSIGLVLAVPITSFIACILTAGKEGRRGIGRLNR